MSTATINQNQTEEKIPFSALAVQLNRHLESQPAESTLDRLDRCDRCPSAAQSTFTFPIAAEKPGDNYTCDILLCGHHMRLHLNGLLERNPARYWIQPGELWNIRGVTVPAQDHTKTGDGLTDN